MIVMIMVMMMRSMIQPVLSIEERDLAEAKRGANLLNPFNPVSHPAHHDHDHDDDDDDDACEYRVNDDPVVIKIIKIAILIYKMVMMINAP